MKIGWLMMGDIYSDSVFQYIIIIVCNNIFQYNYFNWFEGLNDTKNREKFNSLYILLIDLALLY